jgi:hypothetical protein
MSPPVTPEEIVREQLDAYNARDIERFMKCWHADARMYEFPDKLMATGHAEIRPRHVARFTETNLHAELLSRTSVGNVVVDRERVKRMFEGREGTVDVIAIYEVVDGKIMTARFKLSSPVF